MAGIALALAYIFWLAASSIFIPEKGQLFIAMTATHMLFGRVAGLSFGYTVGLGNGVVIPISMVIETIIVLLFYPLFVVSWHQLIVFERLQRFLGQVSEAADRHVVTIKRYGLIGLFIFVWFPLWMTGPLVGSIIGFLIGLSSVTNVLVVLVATYLAITGWALFLRELHGKVAMYSPYAPMVLFLIILIIGAAGYFMHKRGRDAH